jgi:phospholipase C
MKRIPWGVYLLLVLACSGALPAQPKETRNIHFSTPFRHVVVIFQENRTPDNLFQGLCHPPFGDSDSCSTTPKAHQYNIATTGWLDKHSPTGGN